MLKETPLHVKGPAETVEKLGQSSLIKSDSECSSKKLSTLNIIDKCQETKHSASDYSEGQSAMDSPTKLSKVLESYSKENGGLNDNDKLGEDKERQKLQTHSPSKEKVCTTKKVEREHYCKKRRHSENEEKLDSRDSRKRRTYSSERGKQDHHYKKHHDNGSKYKLMHNERSSRSSGRYPDYRSHSREQNDKDGGWYYLPKRDGSWNRERYYQDIPRRWDKGRYYYDYYPFHAPRDSRERKFSHVDREYEKPSHIYDPRSYKDYYYKTRWIHEPATKEREKRNFSSSKGDFHHCPAPPQHSEKYSSEKSAPTPGENTSSFETSCLKYEDVKDRKRRCPTGDESDSEAERERKKTLQREPSEEQKVKKHKKSKKKKKSKDKHREKDSRHYQDSDASMTLSDAEIYKHKKKKKKKKKHAKRSEGFFEHADPHAQKQGSSEMNRTWEKKEDSDLTDDTPVEEHGRHGYERLHEEDANSSFKKKCLEGGKENSYPVSREDSKATILPSHKDHGQTAIKSLDGTFASYTDETRWKVSGKLSLQEKLASHRF